MRTRSSNLDAHRVELQACFFEADQNSRRIRDDVAAIRVMRAEMLKDLAECKFLMEISTLVVIGLFAEFLWH